MGYRTTATLVIGLLGFAAAPPLASAVDNSIPAPPPPQPTTKTKPTPKPPTATTKDKNDTDKDNTKTQPKNPSELFIEGYKAAHALIYKKHDYAAGIAALRVLGHDDHPDVANLLGYSSRKVGRYDDAKYWYEKALAADPNHALTWSYYGMWHAEQGNMLKARDHLAKVASICGTTCREYVELKGVIEGTRLY